MKLAPRLPKLPSRSRDGGNGAVTDTPVAAGGPFKRLSYRTRNLLLALGIALVAAILTLVYVRNYKKTVDAGAKPTPVFVAARDIPAGTTGVDLVRKETLVRKEIPRRDVVPGAISSPKQVTPLVAVQKIYAGEQITARRFRPFSQQGLRAELKGSLRALSVNGDPNQLLHGILKVGDRVDVIATIKYAGGDPERWGGRVLLRKIRVLRPSGDSSSGPSISRPGGNYSAVLAMTDTQAQKMFWAMKHGKWSLALRPQARSSDSVDSVDTILSMLNDGLTKRQKIRFARLDGV